MAYPHQQHLFLRLHSTTYAHACVHVSSLGRGFRFTWCVAWHAQHRRHTAVRRACRPGAPPPLLQLHAGSSSPVTRSQDRSRGCAATMPCYLHARTLRAQHAARSLVSPSRAASPPQTTLACRCSMPGRPARSCMRMRLRLLERPGERTNSRQRHTTMSEPIGVRAYACQ
jgi:hypothetical protein